MERVLAEPPPWAEGLSRLIREYSTNQDYAVYDIVAEAGVESVDHGGGAGAYRPGPFRQTVDEYVESFHSRNGFSRARLEAGRAREFDERLRSLVGLYRADDNVALAVLARITWARPGGRWAGGRKP